MCDSRLISPHRRELHSDCSVTGTVIALQRSANYMHAEAKLWADTNKSNLEYMKTLCDKEKYEKALRERVSGLTRLLCSV